MLTIAGGIILGFFALALIINFWEFFLWVTGIGFIVSLVAVAVMW